MRIIGITGGIASGKSTVSNYLIRCGYSVVDADHVARQVVAPGTRGLKKIVQTFGPQILTDDGRLDRQKLGQVVFNSPNQLQRLNEILQPLIRQEIIRQLTALQRTDHQLIFLDAPLLFEQHYDTLCDLVMVVVVSPAIQLKRLMKRNQLTVEQAEARIKSQLPLGTKKTLADLVIDNDSTIARTEQQVQQWLDNVQ
ncbi:dephospho-CoA kinase [Limosilactobacillus coleohominis 101-4-CHN]|uniref:Dephospho-CoA kinase n=1 Tax=Limosilactobacillus coleohominis 101-4-CHN TaxID=575594 RepID=C7XTH9_9LACO|nr:dephospho-CoA kinase [Limosilactobacillus coleohominis]EEU31152.1 dephospho-CoA kinase [Limosilactobacillus coleohominis 101-4-CHN]